mmetsp:Transcript_94258/g.224407  ORF Transcript_94258/g.224407 Transcript_94258/m.224407 type:complete len:240 (+) Transcript_94258:1121-1840(+)
MVVLPQHPQGVRASDVASIWSEITGDGTIIAHAPKACAHRHILQQLLIVDSHSKAVLQGLGAAMALELFEGSPSLGAQALLVSLGLKSKADALVILQHLLRNLLFQAALTCDNKEGRRSHVVRKVHSIGPASNGHDRFAHRSLWNLDLMLEHTRQIPSIITMDLHSAVPRALNLNDLVHEFAFNVAVVLHLHHGDVELVPLRRNSSVRRPGKGVDFASSKLVSLERLNPKCPILTRHDV